MNIYNTGFQSANTPAHVYLLQVDSNYSPETQMFPVQFLHNTPIYSHEHYLLPILSNQISKEELQIQQVQVLNGVDVDSNQYLQRQQETPMMSETTSLDGHTSDNIKISSNVVEKQRCNKDHRNKTNKIISNFVHISDRNAPPRAVAVLPAVLQIRALDVIYPRRKLPACVRFGPVQGIRSIVSLNEVYDIKITTASNKRPIFLLRDEYGNVVHIDVSDKDKSNWIGLLPLGDETTANVWLYEEDHELYAVTTECIASRKTLMIGYSKQYAEEYGILDQPTKDIKSGIVKGCKLWCCFECERENKVPKRRRYQCGQCVRTFSRLFSLRRHRRSHYTNTRIPVTSDNLTSAQMLPDFSLSSVPNTEDRIPSDESFQNYSNGLDFSTNLFDTDRMPSLDISGSSRSNSDLINPYSIGYKDDNAMMNDLGFTNPCATGTDVPQEDIIEIQSTQKQFFNCAHCNQQVAKGKYRQHKRECPAQRYECECGKVFKNKKHITQHIHKQHSASRPPAADGVTSKEPTQYRCERCLRSFKRRGMLVNHMWRVHKSAPSAVPLQRRVRQYPCGACPKLYRTAAKRNQHAARHHTGVERGRATAIECGVRACSPALCPGCPRQYATHAKMLQHLRANHAQLAPPLTKKRLKLKSNSMDL